MSEENKAEAGRDERIPKGRLEAGLEALLEGIRGRFGREPGPTELGVHIGILPGGPGHTDRVLLEFTRPMHGIPMELHQAEELVGALMQATAEVRKRLPHAGTKEFHEGGVREEADPQAAAVGEVVEVHGVAAEPEAMGKRSVVRLRQIGSGRQVYCSVVEWPADDPEVARLAVEIAGPGRELVVATIAEGVAVHAPELYREWVDLMTRAHKELDAAHARAEAELKRAAE